MSIRRFRFKKIPTWSVVLGIILLVGVLSMGYGYYHHGKVMLYAGFALTILGVFNAFIFSAVNSGKSEITK